MNKQIGKVITIIITIIIVAILLTSGSFSKYYVTIVDSNNGKMVSTNLNDPLEILKNENIILNPYDIYIMTDFDKDKMATLEIIRANEVLINVDNNTYKVHQSLETVANAIEQANITLNENDLVDMPLNKIITEDTQINIIRVTTRIIEEDEVLHYETITQQTNTLSNGEYRILQFGSNGYSKVSTFQRLHDGEVISEEILSQDYKEPVAEIRLVGDSDYITSRIVPEQSIELDSNGNPTEYVEKYVGKATAYSALGKPTSLMPGDVAMNLSLVPRGSKVYVKTPDNSYVYGYGEVSDTGTALVENIVLVDLFFDSYLESCLFGAKEMEVYVLE